MSTIESTLLLAPNMNKFGNRVHDGELLYLAQYLLERDQKVSLADCHAAGDDDLDSIIAARRPKNIVVHLWKNELLLNARLGRLLGKLADLRDRFGVESIVAFGSIATGLREEILTLSTAVDFIVDERAVFSRAVPPAGPASTLAHLVSGYLREFPVLDSALFDAAGADIRPGDVVSLVSSRGCLRACSFCAYNNYTSGWRARPVADLVSDIVLLENRFGPVRIGLFDSNFGMNPRLNADRLGELADSLQAAALQVPLALNVSFDGLDEQVLLAMRTAGVDTILVGLESLNSETLEMVYAKKQDLRHAVAMIERAEALGIAPVVSYILFHPWLSLGDLEAEIDRVEKFGRHRIVQFASRSKLQVIPGTPIEARLRSEGLLRHDPFFRDFRFADGATGEAFRRVHQYFASAYPAHSLTARSLSLLKMKEWEYLKTIVRNTSEAKS